MAVSAKIIQIGKCFLTNDNVVRRVVAILPDGRVQYEWRGGYRIKWKSGILSGREFALAAEREVPCDWTPEDDG